MSQGLLESFSPGALVLDPGGIVIMAADAVTVAAGHSPGGLAGQRLADVFPWIDRPDHREALAAAIAGRRTTTRDVVAGGRVLDLEWRPLDAGDGPHALLIAHGLVPGDDAPDYRTIVENLPGIVYRRVRGTDGRITVPYISPSAEAATGIPHAELSKEPTALLAHCHPDDRAGFLAAVNRSADTLVPHATDARVVSADGTIRWLRSLGNPGAVGDGIVVWDGINLDITGLKRREAELAAAEGRFRDIILGGSDWVWETDATGRFSYLSERFEEVTGIPIEGVIGRTRREAYRGDFDDHVWREHEAELAEHKPFRERTFEAQFDGRRRWIRVSGVPMFEDGVFRGYRGVATEITDQVEIQQRLQTSEARFRDVVEASSDWIWEMDAELRFTFLSDRYTEATGIPLSWVIGKRRQDLMAATNPPELIDAHVADLEARRPVRGFRYAFTDGHGQRRFQLISGVPTFDPAGRFTGYRGTGTDITAQVQAELRLQESETRFRDVAEAASDWIWEMDAELRFTFLSDRFEEVTGIDPGQVLGNRRTEVAAADNDKDTLAAHLADLEARRPFKHFRYILPCQDGGVRHMMVSGVPMFAEDGRFLGYRGTGTDVTAQVEAERLAAERQALLEQAVEAIAHGFALFDEQDRLMLWNTTYAETLGFRSLETGMPYAALVDEALHLGLHSERLASRAELRADFLRRHREADGRAEELRLADGSWIASSKTRLANGCTVTVQVDITELKEREQALRDSETRYRELAAAAFEGILFHRNGVVIDVNRAFLGLTGHLAREEVVGQSVERFFGASPAVLDSETDERVLEAVLQRADESTTPVEVQCKTVRYQGESVGVIAMRDVSERRQAEARIRHLAHHDALTGLPNRALFNERLDAALAKRRRDDWRTAILQLDLDDFKNVNDSLGHAAGDFVLQTVAERLRECVRENDTVARIGGDEFAVLLDGLPRGADAAQMAQRIVDRIREPLDYQGHSIHTGTSIGVTIYPDDDRDPSQLLKNADIALYRAKASGRNAYSFFVSTMKVEVELRRDLENQLRDAIRLDQFRLAYQPQIDLRDGRVVGIEALLRWHHPERGLLAPRAFLPVAEETGLIVPIGRIAMLEACRAARGWLDQGLEFGRIAINMATAQLKMGRLSRLVRDVLREADLPPDRLEIEITEGVFLGRGNESVAETLRRLARMQVRIALDDFGTGYASLAHLKRFPLHRLKIDQSFIRNIGADPEDAAIVRTVLSLGTSLGLEVVAEGVETIEQQRFLQEHDCNVAQGYLFSRPIPANEVALFLEASRAHGSADHQDDMLAIEPV